MSAGPDGRYVRCTARDWGGALLYWWGYMFPQFCLSLFKALGFVGKKLGMVFSSTSKIVGGPVAGAFGGVVPRGCYTTERRFFAHEASMDAYKSSGRRLHEQALSLQFQVYMQHMQQQQLLLQPSQLSPARLERDPGPERDGDRAGDLALSMRPPIDGGLVDIQLDDRPPLTPP